MIRIKYLLFTVCLCFMFLNNVDALGMKLVTNSNEVFSGEVASVKVEFDIDRDDISIDYCQMMIKQDSSVKFQEIQALNSWTIMNKNILEDVLEISIKNHQNNLYGNINIANLKYLVSDSGSLRINSVSCYDKIGNLIEVTTDNDLKINAVQTTGNILKSLTINNGQLNPSFSSNVRSYTIDNFNSNSLSLNFELFDSLYQDDVQVLVNDKVVTDYSNIPYELSADNKVMLVTIKVGDSSSYNIFVDKGGNSLTNDYVKNITVNGMALELKPGVFDYVYTASGDVKNVEVLAELFDNDKFEFGTSSNIPASFNMPGRAVAVLNVVPRDKQSGISAVTYTVTVASEGYLPNINNPDTADTSMYIVFGILILSLIGSAIMYQKNLNAYK